MAEGQFKTFMGLVWTTLNPLPPSGDGITFEGEIDLLTFEEETEIITFEI